MNLFLVLLGILTANSRCVRTKEEGEELPTIFIGLEGTLHEAVTLPIFGSASILWPEYGRTSTVKCSAEYPILWVASVPILSYPLPDRIEDGDFEDSVPQLNKSGTLYLSTISLKISNNTFGFASCRSAREPRVESTIKIYGDKGKSYRQQKYTRSRYESQAILNACVNNYILYQSKNGSRWEILDFLEGWRYGNFPPLGLIFNGSVFDKVGRLGKCLGMENTALNLEFFINEFMDVEEKLPFDLQSLKPASCNAFFECRIYQCQNPYHCNTVLGTTAPGVSCDSVVPSGVRVSQCDSKSVPSLEYFFRGVGGTRAWYPSKEGARALVTISAPKDQMLIPEAPVTFSCHVPSFLFSKQLIFSVGYSNGTVRFLREPEENGILQNVTITRNVTFDMEQEMSTLNCLATWYTYQEWRTATFSLIYTPTVSITMGLDPEQERPDRPDPVFSNRTFFMYAVTSPLAGRTIDCTATLASGHPPPNITWAFQGQMPVVVSEKLNDSHRISSLTFLEPTNTSAVVNGACTATTSYGTFSVAFVLSIEESKTWIVLLIGLLLSLVVIAMGLAIWKRTDLLAKLHN